MVLFEDLKRRLKVYSLELGHTESLIENERITNPAHKYNKRKIALEAKIELIEELIDKL